MLFILQVSNSLRDLSNLLEATQIWRSRPLSVLEQCYLQKTTFHYLFQGNSLDLQTTSPVQIILDRMLKKMLCSLLLWKLGIRSTRISTTIELTLYLLTSEFGIQKACFKLCPPFLDYLILSCFLRWSGIAFHLLVLHYLQYLNFIFIENETLFNEYLWVCPCSVHSMCRLPFTAGCSFTFCFLLLKC